MNEQIKVLVIEDSRQFREFIVEYLLKPNNFAVEIARDGLSGLNKALEIKPDLILLDYELPRLNGNEVLRRLRDRGLKTPVILMTSHGSDKISLGEKRQPVTVLFADLRGFSTFANKTSPEKTVDTIKQYVGAAVEAIMKEQGTLDKFIGDAVMAFFNAPLSQPDHVLRAIRATY